jgi:hypothetical protein
VVVGSDRDEITAANAVSLDSTWVNFDCDGVVGVQNAPGFAMDLLAGPQDLWMTGSRTILDCKKLSVNECPQLRSEIEEAECGFLIGTLENFDALFFGWQRHVVNERCAAMMLKCLLGLFEKGSCRRFC